MPTTDTSVSQVIVNKLTKAQYDSATKSATEFYAVTDVDSGEAEVIGTTTGDNQNYCIKYADGRLVAIIRKAFSNAAFSAWGSCYGHEFGAGWLGNYAVAFKYKPVVNCYATSSAALWVCVDTGNDNESLTAAPTVGLARPSTNDAVSGAMHLIAYGFWK